MWQGRFRITGGQVQTRSTTRVRRANQQSNINTSAFGPQFGFNQMSGVFIKPATNTQHGTVLKMTAVSDSSGVTDSTGGTPSGALIPTNTPVTGVDGTGNNAASKTDVDARLDDINNNLADVANSINGLSSAINTLLSKMRGSGIVDP